MLNANRTYYLTRSQPPFLTSMIRAVYEDPASFPATPAGRTEAQAWLEHAYTLAEKDYSTWTRPEHKAGSTGLARYFDYGAGPVPEMADDSTYYIDVIRWLVAHPHQGGEDISGQRLRASRRGRGRAAQTDQLRRSCQRRLRAGMVRRLSPQPRLLPRRPRHARVRLRSQLSLWPLSGATHHYAPVCLNSLLYRYERDLEHLALLLGKPAGCRAWDRRAKARAAAIQRYLWRAKDGVFADFDFVHARPSSYAYITSLYPLVGRRRHARASYKDSGEAQSLRAPRRLIHEQYQHWHAMG